MLLEDGAPDPIQTVNTVLGVGMGLAHLATDSEGDKVASAHADFQHELS
ncbi:MAG: hypothetical protein OIF57_12015 [Marinobacterium sp.]|nr:hypothetical protein [Marinobacterium sp.]